MADSSQTMLQNRRHRNANLKRAKGQIALSRDAAIAIALLGSSVHRIG